MRRDDLLALGESELVALANRGLFKRASKELGKGNFELSFDENGVVLLKQGNATVRLEPGSSLGDTQCTCGARGFCRHKLLAVLAYQASQGSEARSEEPWNPGDFEDDVVQKKVGASTWRRANRAKSRGVRIRLKRGSKPVAFLPTCSVSFLVPNDLGYARCDCSDSGLCQHIVLAIWAFRQEGEMAVFEASAKRAKVDFSVSHRPVSTLLEYGLDESDQSVIDSLLSEVRTLTEQGLLWLADIGLELASMVEAYQIRSAAYDSHRYSELLVEWFARTGASQTGSASLLLGLGESAQTDLEQTTLTCIGVKLWQSSELSKADLYFAEPDTGVVTVLKREWRESLSGPAFGNKRVGRMKLLDLSTGRLVTEAAKRRANRELILGRPRIGQNSLFSDNGDWGDRFRKPLLVNDYAALELELKDRELSLFRARVLAENARLFQVDSVTNLAYSPGSQKLMATLMDSKGHKARLEYVHTRGEPGALNVLAEALCGDVRFVAGLFSLTPSGFCVEPLSVVADNQVTCPSLAAASPLPGGIPRVSERQLESPTIKVWALCAKACHQGLRFTDSTVRKEAESLEPLLRNAGFYRTADELANFARSVSRENWWRLALRTWIVNRLL